MPAKLSPQLFKESQNASFIFAGRVRTVGANNLTGIQPEANHALVEVEDVVIAPTNLGDLRGHAVTVVLAKPAKKGDRHLWWANSWVFGNEIGVIETARAKPTSLIEAADQVSDARLRALDDRVRDRVTGADVIVTGTVFEVEELGLDEIAEGTTWRRARVRVSRVVKGKAGAEVTIQFPGAGSPRWANAPRIVEGQKGVWLLRKPERDPRMRAMKVTGGALVALDPDDVRASSSLQRIEALTHHGHLQARHRNR